MKKIIRHGLSMFFSALLACTSAVPLSSSADWQHIGYMGDLNGDAELNMADLVIMSKHLHGNEALTNDNCYHVKGSFIGINGADGFQAGEYFVTADIDQSGTIDVFDLIQLRKAVISGNWQWVWQWETENKIPDEPIGDNGEFINAPVNDVLKFMPSQGNGRMVIIYADFYDCKYNYLPEMSEVEQAAFGKGDPNSKQYPWESVAAFFNRSSKGKMELTGNAFRYTAQKSVNSYQGVPGQKELLTEACKALDSQINFADYDGDGNGYIDTVFLVVPAQASDDTWWPASVAFSNDSYVYDGMKIGHMITGNCQLDSKDNHHNFISTICHESGHCMGLPDYYFYDRKEDFDGLHGTAGSELMDDTGGDLSCVSKLQLGWYKPEQIQVYDPSAGEQTFTLYNAQTSSGNTVIIPCGELDGRYHGEFMMIEYTTKDGNNSAPPWYVQMGSGVRIYHADTTLYDNGWWVSYKYANSSEFAGDHEGRRFIRLINDAKKDNILKSGDVIDSNTPGFCWYDSSGRDTADTGLVVEIGEKTNDSYTITIRKK